jgi:hypothetical protein
VGTMPGWMQRLSQTKKIETDHAACIWSYDSYVFPWFSLLSWRWVVLDVWDFLEMLVGFGW